MFFNLGPELVRIQCPRRRLSGGQHVHGKHAGFAAVAVACTAGIVQVETSPVSGGSGRAVALPSAETFHLNAVDRHCPKLRCTAAPMGARIGRRRRARRGVSGRSPDRTVLRSKTISALLLGWRNRPCQLHRTAARCRSPGPFSGLHARQNCQLFSQEQKRCSPLASMMGQAPLRSAPFLVAWINEARASVLWETLKSRS